MALARLRLVNALQRHLPRSGRLLEVGSGNGSSLNVLAYNFREWKIQPSEVDTQVLPKLTEAAARWSNVSEPALLDVTAPADSWPVDPPFDCVLAVNVVHYAPPLAMRGLFLGSDRLLRTGGKLCVYGPFLRPGKPRSFGSRLFDAALWLKNPGYGIRSTQELLDASLDTPLTCSAVETVARDREDLLCMVFTKGSPESFGL
jgi:SAM-dependent methyltransferase